MFLKGFEGWHILIILGLLVVLFGARKLPDSARSIGQSLRIFKSEMKAAGQDDQSRSDEKHEPDQSVKPQPQALEQGAAAAVNGAAGVHAAGVHTADHVIGHDTAGVERVSG